MKLSMFRYGQGRVAMAASLKNLSAGEYPIPCHVYVGLHPATTDSSHHAEATERLAKIVVGKEPDFGYRFNSKPPPTTRIFTAASQARLDAIAPAIEDFPEDLSSPLWYSVRNHLDVLRQSPGPSDSSEAASELMLRLGYVRDAAVLVGLPESIYEDAPPLESIKFDPNVAIGQYHVLSRMYPDQGELANSFYSSGFDPQFSPYVRSVLLKAFIVHFGQQNAWDERLPAAVKESLRLLEVIELHSNHFDLYAQTVYRAVAFMPFIQKNPELALKYLEQGLDHQELAALGDGRSELLWRDHAFPLFETMSKTCLSLGDLAAAHSYADQLVLISPADSRSWLARAGTHARLDNLSAALADFNTAISLGGRSVAAASFGSYEIVQSTEGYEMAQTHLLRARMVDPLSPSLTEEAIQDLSSSRTAYSIVSPTKNDDAESRQL